MAVEEITILGLSLPNFASMLIAACALGLTLWQGRMTKKHNQLSVLPAICSWLHEDEKTFHYWITNKGHGTARIDNFKILIDGKVVTKEELDKFLKHNFNLLGKNELHTGEFANNSYFEKGEKVDLIKVTFDEPVKDTYAFIEKCDIHIDYSSLYDQKSSFKSDTFKE